jgi:hypothetical protein
MRAAFATVLAMGVLAAPADGHGARIEVLSSRPDQVSGGDALVRVKAPRGARVERNGVASRSWDNQAGDGFRVLAPDGSTAGLSRDCSFPTVVKFLYRTTGGAWRPLPAGGGRPADVAQTTTLDGRTVDFIVRRERATINRFLYSYAMLAPPGAAATDTSRWNRRLVYTFDGGVAIGHCQGTIGSPRWTRSCSASGTRSPTPAARARACTTTSSSAARRR